MIHVFDVLGRRVTGGEKAQVLGHKLIHRPERRHPSTRRATTRRRYRRGPPGDRAARQTGQLESNLPDHYRRIALIALFVLD